MKNEDLKTVLAKGGVASGDIEKILDAYDAEKITEVVEAANTPEAAFKALHELYPQLEVESMQKQCEFIQNQFEAAMKEQKDKGTIELTEDELDQVAGGGFWDWCKSNWKAIAVGAAIVVGAALVCTGVGAGIGALITTSSLQMVAATSSALAFEYAVVTTSMAGVGAAIGAGVGAAAGGVTAGVLAANGTLSKVNG